MKENLIHRLQSLTGESNLQFKRWDTLINLYVLPQIAGNNGRQYISDNFLNLVTDFGTEICPKDNHIGQAMIEICLQRLSNGAIPTPPPYSADTLPAEYRKYSSETDAPYPMTEGCFNFLISGIKFAFCYANTKKHASEILLTLVKQIYPTEKCTIAEFGDYAEYSSLIFVTAKQLLEQHLAFEYLYKHYATPEQWYKHIVWFGQNQHLINWEQFFKDINIAQEGNFYVRWKEKRRIKKLIIKK